MILEPYIIPPITWYIQGIQNSKFEISTSRQNEILKKIKGYAIGAPNKTQILQFPTFGHIEEVNDLPINYQVKWISEHKNALQAAYGNSPFFEFYNYKIYKHFDNKYQSVNELRINLLTEIHKMLYLENFPLNFTENMANEIPKESIPTIPQYPQVFEDKFGFRKDVSILDLIFNLGPMCKDYLAQF